MQTPHPHSSIIKICVIPNCPITFLSYPSQKRQNCHHATFVVVGKLSVSGVWNFQQLAFEWHILTNLPQDRMATILVDENFKCIFLNDDNIIPIRISKKFVPRSPIGDMPALVQVMARRRTCDQPLPEPMLTQFTYAYMWHWWGVSLKIEYKGQYIGIFCNCDIMLQLKETMA